MTQGSAFLDAHAIPEALRSGETTAVDTVQAYLDRIRAVDGDIHAYVDVWEAHAIECAASIDDRVRRGEDPGPLAGVPIALKDNFCTMTGRTECCSRILDNYESPYNATVVDRLLEAGAVLLGKLNMDEFAMGSSTENSARGPTSNPWDHQCVAGGSSGGAAAAVTTFQAAAALGSDTGGSIRQPAAFCGCIGMKPTYGRVSRYGLVAFASSLDQIGPLTRTVEDMALLLKVISGRDELDATSADVPVPDYSATLQDGVSGLTLGIPKEYFTGALGEDMRQKVETAVDILHKQGAKIVDVSLPHTDYGIAVYYIICTAEASANLARFDGVRYGFRGGAPKNIEEMYTETKSEGFGLEVQRRIMLGTYVLSSGYYDAYYLKAQKVRALIRKDFDEALKLCDVLVTPTAPTPAFKIGAKIDDPLEMYLNDVYTSTLNLAGFPGISIPCGFSESGLPTGLQLLGKPFDEATLLRVAYTYEQNRGFDMGLPALT